MIVSFKSLKTAWRHHPSEYLWKRCLSINSQFCESVVSAGYLSWEQMVSAACHYRLGASRQGGVIFWQIDQEERVRDGKVMYYGPDCHRLKDKVHHPTWVSALLHQRDPFPNAPHSTSHCFFGLHLLSNTDFTFNEHALDLWSLATEGTQESHKSHESYNYSCHSCNSCSYNQLVVCVVEAEKSAVILSELYPQNIWLAAGGLGEVQADKFRPLRGYKVIMFPDTDPDGIAFKRWSEAATTVMQQPFWEGSPPIRVSPLLEQHATPNQKSHKIDIVDFLFDNNVPLK